MLVNGSEIRNARDDKEKFNKLVCILCISRGLH